MITEIDVNGQKVLNCDQCPVKPDYTLTQEDGYQWNRSCPHIEEYITEARDAGTLVDDTTYHIPMSPLASWLCRDQWAGFVTLKISELEPSGISRVSMTYDSDLYTRTQADIGFVMPEDGRGTLRLMVWDYLSTKMFDAQPEVEVVGLDCPQRTHKPSNEFNRDRQMQDGLSAHLLTIILENCCCYCYRTIMGNDVDPDKSWGLDTPKAQPQRSRQPGPARQPSAPQSVPSSSRQASPASQSHKVPTQARSRPPEAPTSLTPADPSKKMSEILDDPELPF